MQHPTTRLKKIAVIGSGISGLSAAHALQGSAQVTLLEASSYFGGHANTVSVQLDGKTFGVDTGFLVYNEKTYPGLIQLFKTLGTAVAPSDMGFSVQAFDGIVKTEWAGNNLASVFAQKRQIFSLAHWHMLFDIVRFNRLATAQVTGAGSKHNSALTVSEFLQQQAYSDGFVNNYFLPMIACIWSCPTEQMKEYPVRALLQFCHNHGLLQITNRPQWFTVVGGSKNYVDRIVSTLPDARLDSRVLRAVRHADGVDIWTANAPAEGAAERFDAVIFASHPDQSLEILGDTASAQEKAILGAIRYQANDAALHTDTSVMPENRTAWAAWNYERQAGAAQVCLHYWLNKLQPLPTQTPIFVSLNPLRSIDPSKIIKQIQYDHPIFDTDALKAQSDLVALQGQNRTWFAGAWCRYGFHEDGFQAGLAAAEGILRS